MTIRILIADDHGVIAEALRSLIERESDMEVVALANNGLDAVRGSVKFNPDVVVMDYAMPALNGTEATRIIRNRNAYTRVVMLSMHASTIHIQRALQAGAGAYVLKESVGKELVDAIRAVHAGRRYLSKSLADDLVDRFVSDLPEDPLLRLSARERQVLQMIAEGRSTAEIAAALSLSRSTVETYRERMMDKLGLHNLASLIKFAIQQGITSIE
jgi:DNA-binding NarL/FixJ family response regulator